MKTPLRSRCSSAARFILFLLLAAVWAAPQTQAQPAAPEEKATLAACVKVIKGDSVALFYDANYLFTPMACAAVRRHARIDAKGDFKGETCDYNTATNRLRYRMHYQEGQREGLYESFYPSGKPAVRGNFAKGKPTGSWDFWYANGQHKQTLEWNGQASPQLRIMAYWDSTGQQGVSNGNGAWYDVMPLLGRRYGGPVLGGLAQGVWESRAVSTNKLLTTEVYEQGRFKEGKALDGAPGRYKDHALLEPQISDPSSFAERFQFGSTCEARLAMYQRAELRRTARVVPPKPAGDPASFIQSVLKTLNQSNQRNEWEIIPDGREFEVNALTDDKGYLHLVSGQAGGGIVTALSETINSMRPWLPATVNEKPVPGEVRFLITKRGTVLNMSYQARAKF